MPRDPEGWWDDSRRRWRVKLGGNWHTLYHPDGRPVGRDEGRARKEAIRRLQGEAKRAAAEGPGVAAVASAYVAWLKDQGRAKRTVRDAWRLLTRLSLAEWEGRPIASWPAAALPVEAVWAAREGRGEANNFSKAVRACWKWAARPVPGREPAVLIGPSPLCGLDVPPCGKREGEPPPWEAIRAMVEAAWAWVDRGPRRGNMTPEDRARRALCFELIAATGCRTHEACGLRWDELGGDGWVRVSPGRVKTRGRGRPKPRAFDPGEEWRAHLAAWSDSGRWGDEYVFARPGRRGEPSVGSFCTWVRETLIPWCRASGVAVPEGFTPYAMRHAWSSDAYDAGLSSGQAAQAAGHSPTVSEGTYRHPRERAIAEAFERVRRHRKGRS